MGDTLNIEEKYFPSEYYNDTIHFPKIGDAIKSDNLESLEESILSEQWISEKINYDLVSTCLKVIVDSTLNHKTISSKDVSCFYNDSFLDNYIEIGKYFLIAIENQDNIRLEILESFARVMLYLSLNISDEVSELLEGYPEIEVNALDWISAVTLIEWLEIVAHYFIQTQNYNNLFNTRLCQLKMTIAAKSHYPDEVSWAMMNLGAASEQTNNIEGALQCYDAIINDFSFVLEEERIHENEFLYDKVLEAKERKIRLTEKE